MQYSDTDSSTLYGLKQDIYYLGKVNSAFISDGDLNRIINKYYGQIQERIRKINENFYLVQAIADLVATTNGTYSYPDGTGTAPAYEKMKSVWAAFQPADPSVPLTSEFQRAIIADPDSINNPAYTFSTPTVLLFGTYFILLPYTDQLPGATFPVIGGVKAYYIAQNQKLVNDTDVPLIFPSYHDAITHGSLIDVAQRKGDLQLKEDSIALFKKRCEDIEAFASNHLPDDQVAILEGQDFGGGWAYPWGQNSMS
jgi:hypothetical protein